MSNDTDVSALPDFIPSVSVEDLETAIAERRLDDGSKELLEAEKGYINAWREQTGRQQIVPENLTGLAISGGGIRSATFALGVMQRLAKKKLFEKFDYLSTVSGGGFIGSSLTWLVSATAKSEAKTSSKKKFGMDSEDFPYGADDPADYGDRTASPDQTAMLKYLRQHGNYLTPGKGITAVSFAAVILRAILLNLLVWLPILLVAMISIQGLSIELSKIDFISTHFPPPVVTESDSGVLSCLEAKCIRGTEGPEQPSIRGGRTFLFDLSLWLFAPLLAAWFLIRCAHYSVKTWRPRRSGSTRYDFRRLFESRSAILLGVLVVLLAVGSLPVVQEALKDWSAAAGPGGMVLGVFSAIWTFVKAGKKNGGGVPLRLIATVGAVLFVYGIILLTYSWAHSLYGDYGGGFESMPIPGLDWLRAWHLVVFFFVVALGTGWFVNLNYISIHRYYRDRLMETYMPDIDMALENVTGPAKSADPVRMHNVWPDMWPDMEKERQNQENPRGPYHIVNTNVVLVDATERTRKIRGGDNFILSPLYSGSNATGWCSTKDFMGGGMTLATAMAISGAAANPNTGVGGVGLTRNPVVSLLMAFLNLRLGYWATNPGSDKAAKRRPNHFVPGLYEIGEIFGRGFREDRPFLQLSDGGHFENLALYELIRRRTRLIVCLDGGADKDFSFSDLQITLRRINTDFGARIEFGERDKPDDDTNKPKRLTPQDDHIAGYPKGVKLADQGHIVGDITYADGTTGTLIFLKTTLIPRLRVELMGYKGANPDFPDQTTADQFFDEEQFEAYRELGYTIAKEMINDIRTNNEYDDKAGLREFIPKTQ